MPISISKIYVFKKYVRFDRIFNEGSLQQRMQFGILVADGAHGTHPTAGFKGGQNL